MCKDTIDKKKVYCPNCGAHLNKEPVAYPLEEEKEMYAETLDNFDMTHDNETVLLPSASVQAGPFNGESNLYEAEHYFYECNICNTAFTVASYPPPRRS
jgi:hypothetical protein